MENLIAQAFSGLKLQDHSNAERVASLLDRFDLRWTVSKQPMYLKDGTDTGFMAVTRDDNNTIFQSCKPSYQPYQNSELAELLIRIADKGGYEIHSGGEFKDGAKVYVQLVSGNQIKGIGKNNTIVNGYATGINSHDGSTSLRWGSTNITICCQNTFNAAYKGLVNSARHTNNMQDKVDLYLSQVDGAVKVEKEIFEQYIRLSEIPVTKKSIAKIVKGITNVDIAKFDAPEHTQYQKNRTEELLASIGSEIEQKGETMWGLFSGVTHYTSHKIPVPNRDNARMESKYIGTANQIDNTIFQLINSLN